MSNAFSASSVVKAVSSVEPVLSDSRTVSTFLMLEVADLPWVKLAFDGWMREGIMGANLFTMILESSLEFKFNREIG